MGHFLFFVFVVAACLLWSAACTAAAARTQRPWLCRLLVAAAVIAAPVALTPWLIATAVLAFGGLAFGKPFPVNWFGPTLTIFLSALIGGAWIARAGLAPAHAGPLRDGAEAVPPAAHWPVIGLAALFLMAKAVAGGTLLFIDNAVAAHAPYLRLEAAQLMQTNLPPSVPDSQNAATLYQQAFDALAADATTSQPDGPLASATTIDPADPAVLGLLGRHAATLETIRRAADRDTCRFQRDWTRPSFDILVPELSALRTAGRLLALESRREAAEGDVTDALRDVARMHRMGRHAAGEPMLIAKLVGIAIDTTAFETLSQVLPKLRAADRAALDAPELRDLLANPQPNARHFFGEEALGLSAFAGVADGDTTLTEVFAMTDGPKRPFLSRLLPLSLLYRVFFLEADLAGYRSIMKRYEQLAADAGPYAAIKERSKAIEAELRDSNPGMLSSLVVPALGGVLRAQAQSVVRHRAAAVLVAATKQRLDTGVVPETLDDVAAEPPPPGNRDPFQADKPLLMKRSDDRIVVYSVGPDGEDDGGPVAPGVQKVEGNDDVGLRMAL